MASGESSTESFSKYKWTCTPPDDTIEECDEKNNCKEQIEKCPKPDLVIEKKWEKWTGKPGYYKVYFVVKNIGTATAPKGHYATLIVDEGEAMSRALKPGKTYKSYFKEPVEEQLPGECVAMWRPWVRNHSKKAKR